MSTYIPSFNNERLKEVQYLSSSESPIPPGHILMYMSQQPNVSNDIPNVGIHNSDVVSLSQQEFCGSRIKGNEFGCRSHEMFLMGQMGSQVSSSGIQFNSNQYQNPHESTQDSESYSLGIGNVTSDSKYLKAAQELLHEVVNVKKKSLKQRHSRHESVINSREAFGESQNEQDSSILSAAEKQDLQNKMTKLTSMINEVDRRYKQYYHEMESVVSSFDAIAGHGAANPYTALALQTISRHFRCLKDAINIQKKVVSRRIGETDSNGEGIAISRLKFVDQQVRQHRRVQQFGTIHQHIWRPQRGLPESSVSILRAWLFEHFLHPYPKDSEKIMLARQTGLTRSQVSNWFINARVRLWKPMVEEMYKEESIDAAMDSNSSSDIAPKKTSLDQAQDKDMNQTAGSSYQAHNAKMESTSAYTDFQSTGPVEDNKQVFGSTVINGVSLTLRLQHFENSSLPCIMTSLGSHHHVDTLQGDDGGGNVHDTDGGSSVGAETINFSKFH